MKYTFIKYRLILASLLFSLLFTQIVSGKYSADNDTLKTYQKELKRKARISYRNGFVYDAIDYYQSYIDLVPEDMKSVYRLAYLYYQTRNYELAHAYFDTIISKNPNKYPLSLYYNGQVLMNMESYSEAEESFKQFRRAYRGKRDPEKLRRKAQLYLKSAEWAESHIDSLANITITHLNSTINQPHIEFGPVLFDENTLVYGSVRPDSAHTNVSDLRKLYIAKKQDKEWVFESTFDHKINEGIFHTGNAVFSEKGTHMYFTRCEVNWQNKTICSIYKSEYVNEQWQEPKKLPYPVNDENFTSTQPAIGNNLRRGTEVLYFVSDRPGGKGGLDIWYTEMDTRTGEYRDPRSLGRSVNSYTDECCPHYDQVNRTLYFSSKGHTGFGGFDVFKSTGSRSRWTDALPLPKPINSSFDETYFIAQSSTEGMFTSNRPGSFNMSNGSCCDDIFAFKYNECVKVSIKGEVVNQTNYDFFDELNSRYNLDLEYPKDGIPVEDVSIFVYQKYSDKDEVLVSQTQTNKDGNYNLELDAGKDYSIIVKNYGLFDKRLNISTKGVNCLDTIEVGVSSINYIPEITVRVNVYYGHDKSKLTKQAQSTIDKSFMPLFDLIPNAIIEIGSHTDSTGTEEYNVKLSQRRSESVVNYLADKGISTDRLIAKGYGESRPIAPNTNPDGTDNPENRQLNRRTELKIVGEISSFYIDE